MISKKLSCGRYTGYNFLAFENVTHKNLPKVCSFMQFIFATSVTLIANTLALKTILLHSIIYFDWIYLSVQKIIRSVVTAYEVS